MKGVLAEHLGVPDGHIERVVFPDSANVKPIRDLVRLIAPRPTASSASPGSG